jgi:hypothetical protein
MFSAQTLRKAVPVVLFLTVVFALPPLWWPASRPQLALVLSLAMLPLSFFFSCYVSSLQRPISLQRGMIFPPAIFAVFLLYAFVYRYFCL